MANHKSSKKRIRQTITKRAHNRLYHKTARNAVKALRNTSEKSAAETLLPNRGGIGRYPKEGRADRTHGWVHIDTRAAKSRWVS